MGYATVDDLAPWIDKDTLVRLTDDTDRGYVDDDVVTVVLEAAGLEVDAYLGIRYDLPINPVPPILKKICCDIASYLLHVRRGDSPGDYWQKRYDTAIDLLNKIGTGKLSLGQKDPEKTADMATISGPARVYSRDKLKGF